MDFTLYHGESRVTSPGRLTEFYLQTCAELEKKPNPYIQEVIGHADGLPPGTTYGGFTLILNGNTRLFPNHKPTDDDVSVLVHVLHRHTYITGIDLPYSNLTNCAAEMFGKLLLNSTTLTDLNLMCNEIGSHGAKWLAKGLQFNRSLKNLRMNGNKIGNKGGMHFATMLQLNRTLESLDLGDCDLEIQSLIALATVLHHNKSLRAIDVRGPIIHTIQEEETVHMAHMLQVNHTLQELHLVKMGMTNFGIQQLCDKLVHNKSLRLLDLHCNQISSDGAKSLAELLKHNTPLKILDLAANRIEDDGLVCISDALRYLNDQLVALSVARNNISGIGLMALANALKSNNTLTNVYVWGNSFDESASIDFAKLIKAGRLKPKRTDISPYWIDGRVYLSELAHGLQLYYYWTPLYGDVDEAACNANTYLLKDPNISLSQIDIEESVDTSSIEGNQSF
ncbi:leucine-rich repeat-containing protein 34 isoform X1 [Stegostoma tigrinum]|uniref:leucine-rich repeat-containing protein 34 isoform X1 n=2 Tax=Stegostoma tigrinum TaxID=3053191 RepID=UPI00286FC926|nr:leucine-rich repeat-containing protein 34 isoform X1 [Stegostoma tigrinum]